METLIKSNEEAGIWIWELFFEFIKIRNTLTNKYSDVWEFLYVNDFWTEGTFTWQNLNITMRFVFRRK